MSLDLAHDFEIVVGPSEKIVYLLPYSKEVVDRYKRRKKICNVLQKVSIYLLISVMISIMGMNFGR